MGTTELSVVGDIDRDHAAGIDVDGAVLDGIEADGGLERAAAGRVKHRRSQRGMVSAEWAVGIIAAVALAGVLIAVVMNGPVEKALLEFVLKVIASFSKYIAG